jgi:putative ABC transport system permease protein
VLIIILFFLALIIGVLAGSLSRAGHVGFRPKSVLKGSKSAGAGKSSAVALRHGLVVLQFALSALLIVCTVIVYRQMNFLQEKDLGFNKDPGDLFQCIWERLVMIPRHFKTELLRSPWYRVCYNRLRFTRRFICR